MYQILVLNPEAMEMFEGRASWCPAEAGLWLSLVPRCLCWESQWDPDPRSGSLPLAGCALPAQFVHTRVHEEM